MLIALLMMVFAGEPADLDEAQVFVRGVVIDPAREVVFLKAADGTLEARDLHSGAVRWRREEGDGLLPLARVGPWLAAYEVDTRPNEIQLVLVDADSGVGEVWRSESLAFPSWVSAAGIRGQSLALAPRVSRGVLTVAWEARAEYAGGARPTPEAREAASRRAHGLIHVDPGVDAVMSVASEPLGAGSHPYWDGYAFVEHPIMLDGATRVLTLGATDGMERLSLADRTGSSERELATGRGIRVQLAADGNHLLVERYAADGEVLREIDQLQAAGKIEYPGASWPQALGVFGTGLALIDAPAAGSELTLVVRPGGDTWSAALHAPDPGPRPR